MNTKTVPIVNCYNKDYTKAWHIAYKDGKCLWLDIDKPRNWKKIEAKALKLFIQEDPARNPSRMTIFEGR